MRQRSFWKTPGIWPARGALVLGLFLLSCSKKPAASPAAGAEGEQKAGTQAEEPEDTTPLEPAATPGGVFLRARVKSPGKLLSAVGDAASSPLDWRELLLESDDRAGRVLGSVIDIDGPIEVVVALHPVAGEEPMGVWSVSARGVRAALSGLDAHGVDTRQGPEGLHYFQLSGEDCALGRSLGRSPARIVCADRQESLDSLLAYALRGFPAEPLSESEVAMRVLAEPLQKQYGKHLRGLRPLSGVLARQLHRDHARFDAAVSDAVLGVVDELVALGEDVQGLDFDLWDREGAFESDFALRFAGKSSWLVNTSREWAKSQGPAPELLRTLPADATVAGYVRHIPKRSMERVARVLGELAAGGLESEGISRATADRVAKLVNQVLAADRTVVYAAGPLKPGTSGPNARVTYSLVGVDQDSKQILEIIDGFAAVLADKQLDKVEGVEGHRPRFARKNIKLGAGLPATVYEWQLPPSVVSALERGTEELASEGVTGADAANMQQFERGYIAVLPAGKVTWIALATEREALVDSLKTVSADVPRLGSSQELGELLTRPALLASAMRLGGFVDQLAPVLTPETLKLCQGALRTAPNRGGVPVTSSVSVSAGETTELRWQGRIPDAFLTDLAALILVLAAETGKD